jgi:hypothetical protein
VCWGAGCAGVEILGEEVQCYRELDLSGACQSPEKVLPLSALERVVLVHTNHPHHKLHYQRAAVRLVSNLSSEYGRDGQVMTGIPYDGECWITLTVAAHFLTLLFLTIPRTVYSSCSIATIEALFCQDSDIFSLRPGLSAVVC